jgi:hypothetical protein
MPMPVVVVDVTFDPRGGDQKQVLKIDEGK